MNTKTDLNTKTDFYNSNKQLEVMDSRNKNIYES